MPALSQSGKEKPMHTSLTVDRWGRIVAKAGNLPPASAWKKTKTLNQELDERVIRHQSARAWVSSGGCVPAM